MQGTCCTSPSPPLFPPPFSFPPFSFPSLPSYPLHPSPSLPFPSLPFPSLLFHQVKFERKLEGGSTTKEVQRTLFGLNNPYPQKKVMTFNKMTHDFTFTVAYTGLDQLGEEERRWAANGVGYPDG